MTAGMKCLASHTISFLCVFILKAKNGCNSIYALLEYKNEPNNLGSTSIESCIQVSIHIDLHVSQADPGGYYCIYGLSLHGPHDGRCFWPAKVLLLLAEMIHRIVSYCKFYLKGKITSGPRLHAMYKPEVLNRIRPNDHGRGQGHGCFSLRHE